MDSNTWKNGATLPWHPAGEGMKRQILGYDESLMLVKVAFEKGALGETHTHPHSQSSYVISGAFEFTIGDDRRILRSGDGCFIPPSVPHGCLCLEEGMMIDGFSPARGEFV